MTDILAAIDAAIGCQHCGGPLTESVSDDFCTEHCQREWLAAHAVLLAGYREPWDRPDEFPGIGSDHYLSAAWRLPRSTGNLITDLRAARTAWARATTDEQRAAVMLRMEALRERQVDLARAAVENLRPTMEAIAEVGRQFFAGVAEGLQRIGEALAPVLAELGKNAGVRASRPDDPRERALQARRTRNTGPTRRERAPRRIDARGAR